MRAIEMAMAVALAVLFAAAPAAATEDRVVRMKVTAYCCCSVCCGPNARGITSTGKDATQTHGVAAAPKLLPYGTKLEIPGVVGVRVVDDTGGAMRQDARKGVYHIDLRFPGKEGAHQEALKFGVKWLDVKILP